MIDAIADPPTKGRPPNPEARNERRKQILEAARECFIQDGFAAAPMSKIAGKAGVSVASIYQYFANKDELIHQLVRECFEIDIKKIRMMSSTGFEASNFHDFMQEQFGDTDHLEAVKLRQEILSEATRNPTIAKLMTEAEEEARLVFADILSRAKSDGILSSELDIDAVSMKIVLFHAGVATRLAIAPERGADLAIQFEEFYHMMIGLKSN